LCQQQKFKIIKNESSSGAAWWRCFGFPANLNEHGKHSMSVKALRAGRTKTGQKKCPVTVSDLINM